MISKEWREQHNEEDYAEQKEGEENIQKYEKEKDNKEG